MELLTRLELVTSSASHFYPSGRGTHRFPLPVTPKMLLFPKISTDISGTPGVLGKDSGKEKSTLIESALLELLTRLELVTSSLPRM